MYDLLLFLIMLYTLPNQIKFPQYLVIIVVVVVVPWCWQILWVYYKYDSGGLWMAAELKYYAGVAALICACAQLGPCASTREVGPQIKRCDVTRCLFRILG